MKGPQNTTQNKRKFSTHYKLNEVVLDHLLRREMNTNHSRHAIFTQFHIPFPAVFYYKRKNSSNLAGGNTFHSVYDEPHPFSQNYPFDFNAILNFVFKPDLEVELSSKCRLGNGSGSELECSHL